LFALEAVDFVAQTLNLLSQLLVLCFQSLNQVKQHHNGLTRAFKVLDLVGIKAL